VFLLKDVSNKSIYPELDGIRGSAFLLVLIGHIFSNNPKINPYLVGVPKFGVWMFFVLSSFLLSSYFLSSPEKAYNPMEWLNYIIRRFMRIYPLYAIILMIYVMYHHDISSLHMVAQHLLLQQGMMHFWTMPVEFTFYLVLPIVVLVIVWICRMNLALALACFAFFIFVHQLIFPYTKAIENSIYLFQYLPVFVMGSIGALVHQKMKNNTFSNKTKINFDILSFCIVILLIMITPYPMKHLFGHNPDRYLMNKFMFIGFAWVIFILCVIYGKWVKIFFSSSIMRFFGKISYGGYLIHWLFMQIWIGYYKGLTFQSGLLIFISTIINATLAYYLIERPCMKVNILKRIKSPTVAAQ
jgi:peptidoglycan/LPS O-acetylase OafA/YrhL